MQDCSILGSSVALLGGLKRACVSDTPVNLRSHTFSACRSGTTSPVPIAPEGAQPTSQLLLAFDAAWGRYLERFVAWKFADAASLEAELIKVRC